MGGVGENNQGIRLSDTESVINRLWFGLDGLFSQLKGKKTKNK